MLAIGKVTPTSRAPLNKRHVAAFTLIELLFVIFIMAIVAGFAVPKFNELTTINLRSAARQFSGLINFTFNRAVMTKRQYRLTMNLGEGTYWVEEFVPATPKKLSEQEEEQELAESDLGKDDKKKPVRRGDFQKLTTYLAKPGRLPKGVRIIKYFDAKSDKAFSDTGEVHIYFYPIGETNGGYLILGTTENTAITLRINPITGKVITYRGAVEDFRAAS